MTITRWEYSRKLSRYHFDTTINEDTNPHYRVIGRIEGNLAAVYEAQLKVYKPEANGFLNRLQVQTDKEDLPFTIEYDRAELEYLNLDPDHIFFYNLRGTDSPVVQQIINSFKFKRAKASFHIQKPGGLFPFHIDELPRLKRNDPNSWLDKAPQWAARFEIQVFDWQPGHVWAIGNTYWKQWRAGDIVWHNWRDTPHGTCNFSRSDRVTLQVTGLCSEETIAIINNANHIFRI